VTEQDLGPVAGPAKPAPAALRREAQDLPQPTDAKLWNKVPAPKSAARKRVVFRPAIDPALLARSDSEDDTPQPAAKKVKGSGSGSGASTILSFLPAPKHEAAAGSRGGSSDHFSKAAAAVRKQKQQQQEEAAAAAQAGPSHTAPLAGNEAFRVGVQPAAAGEGYEQGYDADYTGYQDYPAAHAGSYGSYPEAAATSRDYTSTAGAAGSSGGLLQPGMSETDLIEAAIAAEAAKAANRGAGITPALGDVAFKEINAEKLKYMDPAARDAKQGIEAVLGSDYVQRLRAEAAPHTGNKTARRKHQIGTLFHNARMNEIKLMEQRAQGMKTKAETAGKYGW